MGRGRRKATHGLGKAIAKRRRKPQETQFGDRHTTLHISSTQEKAQALESHIVENDLEQFFHQAMDQAKDFSGVNKRSVVLASDAFQLDKVSELESLESTPFLERSLPIPRRPEWEGLSIDELRQRERQAYNEWRSELAVIERDTGGYTLAPYEKNREVWRQLWRVQEKSHIVCAVVDGRNPLFFIPQDLTDSVQSMKLSETDESGFITSNTYPDDDDRHKELLIVLNKADLVPEEAREAWTRYFAERGLESLWVSSVMEPEIAQQTLIDFFMDKRVQLGLSRIHCGFVGFPNVGKSSLINALKGEKTVSTSAHPGHTKHFQSGILSDELMFYDCPGLVFPVLCANKSYLLLNGVVSKDRHRGNYRPPIEILLRKVAPEVLEEIYMISILREKPPDPKLTLFWRAEDLLSAIAIKRGLTVQGGGRPNTSAAFRIVIADWITGLIPWHEMPPQPKQDQDQE